MAAATDHVLALRAKCASLGVPSSIYVNGKRVVFGRDELAKIVFLLEAKAMGEKLHKRTSFDEAKCNVERASSRAHVFWSDPCHGNWSLPASLPPFTQISLWSMHRAGMDVTLWTYHTSVAGHRSDVCVFRFRCFCLRPPRRRSRGGFRARARVAFGARPKRALGKNTKGEKCTRKPCPSDAQ